MRSVSLGQHVFDEEGRPRGDLGGKCKDLPFSSDQDEKPVEGFQ